MTTTKAPRASEAACQSAIVHAAVLGGWLVHATRPAQTQSGRWATPIQGHPGFVDLVLVRGREALFIELKRSPNHVEPAQVLWHDALRRAYIVCGTVWVPEQQEQFIDWLTARPGERRPELAMTS